MTLLNHSIEQKKASQNIIDHSDKIEKLIDYICSFKANMLDKINTSTNNALNDFLNNITDKQQ